MKEKIYPTLPDIREQPTAPVVNSGSDDRGHSYRLKVISDVQYFSKKKLTNGTHSVKNILEWLKL